MKTTLMLTAVVLMTLILTPGCKKEPPAPVKPAPTETGTPAAPEAVKEPVVEAVKKEAFTMDIDLEKAVADLKAEAAKMDIESLQAVAMKYKNAIAEKEAELKTLMDKFSAVPIAEKLSDEAKTLSADIKTLTDAVNALQGRFQVYIDALTEKGADVKELLG